MSISRSAFQVNQSDPCRHVSNMASTIQMFCTCILLLITVYDPNTIHGGCTGFWIVALLARTDANIDTLFCPFHVLFL